jgi:hypothetical protein
VLALATFFVILLSSILVARIATVVLTATGLSRESARFQARSALSGVGFTTSEAESVVNHPVRRRTIHLLMVLGSAGIVSAIATLLVSFTGAGGRQALDRLLVLLGGLTVVTLIASSRWVDRWLSRLIARAVDRWTDLDVRDYAGLLHIAGDYGVNELMVEPEDWLANRTLAELELRDEGIVVLGIERPDGSYLGVPSGSTPLRPHDTLIIYGRVEVLRELDERRPGLAGEEAHRRAVAEHEAAEAIEARRDRNRSADREEVTSGR